MSIVDYRQELKGIDGAERLIMQYEEGGKIQAFRIDDFIVRVGPMAGPAEVRAAFLEAIKE